MNDVAAALAAEREGRHLEALALAQRALANAPEDADALNLMGRLAAGGDPVAAIALQRLALRYRPDHPRAVVDLERALAARPDPAAAAASLAHAIAMEPGLAIHHRMLAAVARPSLAPQIVTLLDAAIRDDPANAAAHAARGNAYVRERRFADALRAYRRALMLEPDDAVLHLAVAELAHALDDASAAAHHRAQAFARSRIYADAGPPGRLGVLLLVTQESWNEHVLVDLIVDAARVAVHRLYLDADAPLPHALPPYDVVLTGMRASEATARVLGSAQAFVDGQRAAVVNRPGNVGRTARPALAGVLAGVPGCAGAAVRRLAREELRHAVAYPALVRPVDTHAGRGLARVENAAALDAYLATQDGDRFDVAPFVEYRSADGWYRKYRVLLVDGRPYPVHLAIARGWMVHYATSDTPDHAWMRAEEERFLREPAATFAGWETVFGAIAEALALDYAGIDCALLDDGTVLVFEADPSMLVHALDTAPEAAYKREPHARIAAALEALLAAFAVRRGRS